jgi:putative methyltransferase (TIGR04325 family)
MSIVPIENQIFPTFDAALNQIGGLGYSNKTLIDVVVRKNLIFRNGLKKPPLFDISAARTLFGVSMALNGAKKLRVLDFGGGGGFHYNIARAILPSTIELDWYVVESSELCAASQQLIVPELKFFDSIIEASKELQVVDLIFTSSTLQYTPNPLKSLEELLKINARYLFITRTPMSDHDETIVCVQKSMLAENGPGPLPPEFKNQEIYYPVTYVPVKEIEDLIKIFYQIRLKIIEDQGSLLFGHARLNNYFGYFCECKN